MLLQDVAIILSRPMEPGNVGAVCRAMKNMGLSRLRLVSPEPMDPEIIRARAVHACGIWETAESFQSLDRASADCSVVIGATRRRGRRRKAVTLSPEEVAAYLRDRPGPAAIVFGNERSGLEAEELALCGLASHIPADEDFPSLNLSHAVQIYAYQLFRVLGSAQAVEGTWIPMNQTELAPLVRHITDALESLGFYKQPGRTEQERFFRDLCSRAGLSIREGAYIKDIFAKAAGLGQKNRY